MPVKSKAQNRLMYLAAAGKSSTVPASVGKKFVAESKGKSVKKLPERKGKKK